MDKWVPMANIDTTDQGRTGLYERTVKWITERLKPSLNKRTHQFVNKSIEQYSEGNPRYAKMIEFEIRRRGDGAGLTQDVAEPIVWTGIKTMAALSLAAVGEYFKSRKNDPKKWGAAVRNVGIAGAVLVAANQTIELFRLIPRYTAGLQGSLEMALDRIRSLKETGVDPFNQQQSTREINTAPDVPQVTVPEEEPKTNFAYSVQKSQPIAPTSLMEQATRPPEVPGRA